MPSSGYTAITFVADELLTSTKMNLMGANDASFNTGNGFNDSILALRHFANSQISASKLDLDPDAAIVATNESTTSASFTNLATVGPAVTVAVGVNGLLLVGIYALEDSGTADTRPSMGFELSGANAAVATDNRSLVMEASTGGAEVRHGAVFLLTGLTAGSTTLTAKYKRKAGAGTALFEDRRIWAIPL